LALGSNAGDCAENLRAAVRELGKIARVAAASSIYKSKPAGFAEQPDFLNAAVKIKTDIPPLDLLRKIKDIEKRLGRMPTFKNGPRIIDIDIIFYGSERIDAPELTIPHPRWQERDFVLLPLYEINNAIKLKKGRSKSVEKTMQNLL